MDNMHMVKETTLTAEKKCYVLVFVEKVFKIHS